MKIINVILLAGTLAFAGCAARQVTKDPVTGNTITNYIPNTYVAQANSGAQLVAPFIPAPWGTILSGLGIIAVTVSGGVATYMNKKLNEHKSMLTSVVAGVEMGNNPQTKQAIQSILASTGLSGKLDSIVQQVTAGMPKS